METRPISKSFFSPILFYSILAWTIICFVGTWFIIFGYGILQNGFIPMVVTLFFATMIWAVPFAGLVLFYLYVTPAEKSSP
jgi:hypothetical protein